MAPDLNKYEQQKSIIYVVKCLVEIGLNDSEISQVINALPKTRQSVFNIRKKHLTNI